MYFHYTSVNGHNVWIAPYVKTDVRSVGLVLSITYMYYSRCSNEQVSYNVLQY